MTENNHIYENPLTHRYPSKDMNYIWSPHNKFSTWRKLWIALAKSEKELGINIKQKQIEEMEQNIYNIDFEIANQKEAVFKHDVMAHVHTFGEACPNAKPIIHLGATSCFVGDNTDLIQLKDSLLLIKKNMLKLIKIMKNFAIEYKNLPTLGYTHYQPAQLTTIGKRATLWLQDIVIDYSDICDLISNLPFRGVKGTTGTQASFLELFDGDHDKVKMLNKMVCENMGFDKWLIITGQTYTRKWDYKILSVLSGIGQSAYKMCSDIRLLASMKEIEEPFGKNQIGSSAMAYKRNPMKSERICSLARYIMNLPNNCSQTHSNQWFERTLDDSANRRIVLPQGFLTTDIIINSLISVMDGIQVWPAVIRKHIDEELPFMATENILMHCVKNGGDRQELHEIIREYSMQVSANIKMHGKPNNLIDLIKKDDKFKCIHSKLDEILQPQNFIGRSSEQVTEFIEQEVNSLLNV